MFDNDDWMNFQFGNGIGDLSNFDDEMDDMESALNEEEPNGGTFKSTVNEFSHFEGEMYSRARRIVAGIVESSELVVNAAPEGIFDNVFDAIDSWKGEMPWEGEQTESMKKYTLGQQQIRVASLAVGDVSGQFYRDLNNGFGMSQHLIDVNNFQERATALGLTVGIAGVLVFGFEAAVGYGTLVAIGAASHAAIQVTGFGVGTNEMAREQKEEKEKEKNTFEQGGTRYYISKSASDSQYNSIVGMEGFHDITIDGKVIDTVHGKKIERSFYNSNGEKIGSYKIDIIRDYIHEEENQEGIDNLCKQLGVEKSHEIYGGIRQLQEGSVIRTEDRQISVKVDSVHVFHDGNESYFTYSFQGRTSDEKVPIQAVGAASVGKESFTHYISEKGQLIFSEFKSKQGGSSNGLDPSLASIQLSSFRYVMDRNLEDPYQCVHGSLLAGDAGLAMLDSLNAQVELNHYRKVISELHSSSRLNAGLMSAFQSFTFSNGGEHSVFDALGYVIEAPFTGLEMCIAEKREGVANFMVGTNTLVNLISTGPIAGSIAGKIHTSISGASGSVTNASNKFSGIASGIGNTFSEAASRSGGYSFKSVTEAFEEIKEDILEAIDRYVSSGSNSFTKKAYFSEEIIGPSKSLSTIVTEQIKNGAHRMVAPVMMSASLSLISGNFEVSVLSYIDRNLRNAEEFMFGSGYKALIGTIEENTYNVPILSGIVSGRALTMVAQSVSFKDVSRAIRNNELRTAKMMESGVNYSFEKEQFNAVMEDIKKDLVEQGVSVDLRDITNNGTIYVRKIASSDGYVERSQVIVTSDVKDLADKITKSRNAVITAEAIDIQNTFANKYAATRYLFKDSSSLVTTFFNNPDLINDLGIKHGIFDDRVLFSELVNGLSKGDYKSRFTTLEGNFDKIKELFSSDSELINSLHSDINVSQKIGVVFDNGSQAYSVRDIVNNFYNGDWSKYSASPDEWKQNMNNLGSVSQMDPERIREEVVKYVVMGHGGLDNANNITDANVARYMDAMTENEITKNDEWDETNYSRIQSKDIRIVSTGSTKNFWSSMARLSIFGTRDPFTTEGRYTLESATLSAHIHNNDVSSQMFSSIDAGMPTSILGMARLAFGHDFNKGDWSENLVYSDFAGIRDNVELDDRFFTHSNDLDEINDTTGSVLGQSSKAVNPNTNGGKDKP